MFNIVCSTNTACWNACLFCLTELEGDHVDYVEQEIGAKGICCIFSHINDEKIIQPQIY